MEPRNLKIHNIDQVAYCFLNRPEKRNALSLELLRELLEFLNTLAMGSEVRVLVLRGQGKVFSAGADLSMMSGTEGKSGDDLQEEAGLFFDCFTALSTLPMPVVSYAHGGVHGGACGLLAAADFSLADPQTEFSFREVRMGLIPATVAPFILKRTGLAWAKRMMLGGYVFGCKEAESGGLIDQVCTLDEADEQILHLVNELLKNGPEALSITKKLLIELADIQNDEEIRELCTGLIARKRLSEEAGEGINAFFEKRKPHWNS